MNLETIQQQMIDANVNDLFGTKKEVKALPDILSDDEVIQYATSGFIGNSTVLVVLTQKRVIFIDKGLLYGIKSTEIPLDMVNGVSYEKGLVQGKVSVVNGAVTTEITNIAKDNASTLSAKIKETAESYKEVLRNNRNINNTSIDNIDNDIDQIRKFKSLLDDGILTKDEFEAKKKQILGI
ncbi:PH domain-containing protein [Lentilactobacillus kosonis]|uniref:Short C-terminal domain-containing protein n=1 Tax=Lentilactobacillus kosonis TaxID=2810561 RepID=A0A401FPJ0_9LACO|nr:PH domain-containing protein [Lentilactobacillus kosonis]GAY74309.1 hypothetical protein NBRC111893_2455 [Lentilactobacillus kosonis]